MFWNWVHVDRVIPHHFKFLLPLHLEGQCGRQVREMKLSLISRLDIGYALANYSQNNYLRIIGTTFLLRWYYTQTAIEAACTIQNWIQN